MISILHIQVEVALQLKKGDVVCYRSSQLVNLRIGKICRVPRRIWKDIYEEPTRHKPHKEFVKSEYLQVFVEDEPISTKLFWATDVLPPMVGYIGGRW